MAGFDEVLRKAQRTFTCLYVREGCLPGEKWVRVYAATPALAAERYAEELAEYYCDGAEGLDTEYTIRVRNYKGDEFEFVVPVEVTVSVSVHSRCAAQSEAQGALL